MIRTAIVIIACCITAACTMQQPSANQNSTAASTGTGDAQFKTLHDKYVVEFLRRYPVVNTYLGGSGLDPSLKEVDGKLRDYSPQAIAAEDQWLGDVKRQFEAMDPSTLSGMRRIDREVVLAQINYLLHLHGVRKYQERSVDSYTDEPFRGVDWQLQGMTTVDEKSGKYGTPDEWELVIKRLQAVPAYLQTAQAQLNAGVNSGNFADWRMLKRNGISASEANAKYFSDTLPKLAGERVSGEKSGDLVSRLSDASKAASKAYLSFRDYVATTFFTGDQIKQQFAGDHYAMGESEYDWALRNNLRLDKGASQLFDESMAKVQETRSKMVQLAREIGHKRNMTLPVDDGDAVRQVMDAMSEDYPKTDAELIGWYRDAAIRLVNFARDKGMFDIPADYKLDVTETPGPLRASVEGAAYYPAPPFKESGVGRFYVTTSGTNDQAVLKMNNRASIADLSAHEGFPGHDWDYKVMAKYRDQISGVRWLTPGAVEDSSSMWEDSLAAEGWALYAEALMAEPQAGAPDGFYTQEEHFYQLQGQLFRDLRVRIDTGLHTGKIGYDEAVDLYSQTVDFEPGKCTDAAATAKPSKRASCDAAEGEIFRYSKWPTQAITYQLGKSQILDLRNQASQLAGSKFSLKDFHVNFMKQGTIPPGYFKDELLAGFKR